MNLQTEISPKLWHAVRSRWDNRDFSGAILDAIYFLSDLIREKSDLEGDGVSLVGQAFGGNNPKIKVTRLHTESDRNIQSGVEALLRGIYQAVRNPRSHEKVKDSEDDAAAIIVFIDYLIRVIGEARSVFSQQEFLERVFDPDFVKHSRYAELLVDEIPSKKRLGVALDVFRQRVHGDGYKLRYFFEELLPRLEEDELTDFFWEVSDELKLVDDDSALRSAIQIIPAETWQRIDEVAKLRIENKLLESIKDGEYDERTDRSRSGALGTWARRIMPYFVLRDRLRSVLITKLKNGDWEEQGYVLNFFFSDLCQLDDMPTDSLERAVKRGLEEGDKRFKDAAQIAYVWSDREWSTEIQEALSSFEEVEPDRPLVSEPDDDLPF